MSGAHWQKIIWLIWTIEKNIGISNLIQLYMYMRLLSPTHNLRNTMIDDMKSKWM